MTPKLKLFIVASVLLNVLLIGFLAGQTLHRFGPTPTPHHEEQAIGKLPPEKQIVVRSLMDELRKEGDSMKETMRAERDKLREILAAEQFDESAYRAQLDKIGSMYRARKDKLADRIAELAKTWPAADRAILADLTRRPPSSSRCEKHDGPPPAP
jgi:uncharacterized membrane protein